MRIFRRERVFLNYRERWGWGLNRERNFREAAVTDGQRNGTQGDSGADWSEANHHRTHPLYVHQ